MSTKAMPQASQTPASARCREKFLQSCSQSCLTHPLNPGILLPLLALLGLLFTSPSSVWAQDSVALVGAGSTVPLPLYTKWGQEFNKRDSAVQMKYQPLGTEVGISLVAGSSERLGRADFGAGEVALSEKARLEDHLIELPAVIIAIVPIYNLPGVPELKFNGELLSQLFLGRVKTWNDPQIARLNPGVALPSLPVKIIYRPGGKGTNFVFTDFLSKTSPDFRATIGRTSSPKWPTGEPAGRSSDMVDKVKAEPGALGYVELQYALAGNVSFGLVQNSAGRFVKASEQSILAACRAVEEPEWNRFAATMTNAPGADSFPITSFTWLYVRSTFTDIHRGAALLNLLHWIFSSGQQIAAREGYTQLPPAMLQKIEERIATLK